MTLRPLVLALAAALALPLTAQAANFTYHGDLMDGDAPAEGAYDLRVRSFAQPGASKSLGEATELPAVKLVAGRFNVELDLPEDADGTSWVEVAVRKAGSGDSYVVLGEPQPVTKVNSTCPGAWALDGNSGAPVGSYLGFADARTVFINSPVGVALHSMVAPTTNIDLSLNAKSGGDADTDLELASRNGKRVGIYVRDSNGNLVQYASFGAFEFFDGVARGIQNDGRSVLDVSGRLRSGATGTDPGDTSGGLWLDDENASASFVGRGNNDSNWTGVFAANAWRMVVTDSGQMLLNTTSPTTASDDVVLRAAAGSSDFDMVLATQAGPSATIGVSDVDGALRLDATRIGFGRSAFANKLEVAGSASKTTAGDWLANSDRRIKTGIAPIPNALDTIMKLRPVTFRYADDYRKAHDSIGDERYYNVIAQEFAEVFPDAVKGSGEYLPGKPKSKDNEILQVDTYPAQIASIAAIQELAVQDEALIGEVAALRQENAKLRDETASMRIENASVRAALAAVMARVNRLESRKDN